MHCWVYKGSRRAETYLFLAREEGFEVIPQALWEAMGHLEQVLDIDLTECQRLARADVSVVRAALAEKGYYLQLPPSRAPVGN